MLLQRIRDKLHGPLAWVVLGPIILVFVAWGAYGIVNLSVGGSNYAAEADGSKISLEDARGAWLRQQAVWQQRLGGAALPDQVRDQLQQQTLENLIKNALIAERTQKLGYRVSAAQLHEAVTSEPAFQIGGQYSPEAARLALAQAGISLENFEAQLRDEARRTQLEAGIRASNFMTAAELSRLNALENQQREVRYLVLPEDKYAAGYKPDDAAIAAYYQAHAKQYLTNESDKIDYAELRLDALAAQQTVTDADLHAAYDKAKSSLLIPEKRHARHILIPLAATASAKDAAAALALAQQVLAQANAGKDFGELAKQYSQDLGSAKNGGDLGWAERSSFVAPFADALFGMSVGQIKGPVKTEYGYHIIRLDEVQAAHGKSFEDARADLEAQLRRDRATDRFGEIQEQLQAKLAEPGADLNVLAQEFHLGHGQIDSFAKGVGAPPLGAAPQLQALLFADPAPAIGKIAGPVLLGDDRLVLAKVLEHRAPQPRPLADVREAIVAAMTREQASQAALKAAEAARDQMQAGASFDAVAQGLKVSAEPAHFVGRNDPSLQGEVRTAVFAVAPPAGKPQFRALGLKDGSAAVFEVSAVRTAPAADDKAQFERGLREAQNQGQNEVLAYLDEMRRTADVKKNPKAFE
jgi:peptidyl-prolyl cis-trans isomerase D